MDPRLAEFDHEWKHGDRAKAKEIAKAWAADKRDAVLPTLQAAVRANREAHLDDPPEIADLVALVSAYRAAGREEDRLIVDALLLAGYEPQNITGSGAVVRPLPTLPGA